MREVWTSGTAWTFGPRGDRAWSANVVRAILIKDGVQWRLAIDLREDGTFSGTYEYFALPESGTTTLAFKRVQGTANAVLVGQWRTAGYEGIWRFELQDWAMLEDKSG